MIGVMSNRRKTPIRIAVVLIVVAAVAVVGYFAISARSTGSGTTQPRVRASSSPWPSGSPVPKPPQRWLVAKAVRSVTVYARPSRQAQVRVQLGKTNANGYPTVMLVHEVREVADRVWYNVWLSIRPNMSRGWVEEGGVAIYPTVSKIKIDLSERRLYVYKADKLMGKFPVAVGTPDLPTPTGFFYVNQKLRPSSPGGAYGVLAVGISAFQPKLSYWPQGGPVAIHGTNEDDLIGKAVSHGCVRMHDADILKVNDWVPAGSPVVIRK